MWQLPGPATRLLHMMPTDEMLGPRDVVTVHGPDAESYLHSQLSQTVTGMAVGDARWTFALEPTGKIVALARVVRRAADVIELDTDRGFGAALAAQLNRFKIRVDAEVSVTERDHEADEVARIEAGWPKMGVEIVPGETIPGGTGLIAIAVDFTKGCYPGQELVERMDSRSAAAPRSLRRLTVADGTGPGAPVVDGDKEVGLVTSVAGEHAIGWITRTSEVGDPIDW